MNNIQILDMLAQIDKVELNFMLIDNKTNHVLYDSRKKDTDRYKLERLLYMINIRYEFDRFNNIVTLYI